MERFRRDVENMVEREGDFDLDPEPPVWSGPAPGDGGKIPVEYLPGDIGGDGVIEVPSPGDDLTEEREAADEWLNAASAAAAESNWGQGGGGDDDIVDDQDPQSQAIGADPTPSFTATDDLTNVMGNAAFGGAAMSFTNTDGSDLAKAEETNFGKIDFNVDSAPANVEAPFELTNAGGIEEHRGDEPFSLKMEDTRLVGDDPGLFMEGTGLGELDGAQAMMPDDDDDPLDGI